MHLAAGLWDGDKDMRLNKEVKIRIQSIKKEVLFKSLRSFCEDTSKCF